MSQYPHHPQRPQQPPPGWGAPRPGQQGGPPPQGWGTQWGHPSQQQRPWRQPPPNPYGVGGQGFGGPPQYRPAGQFGHRPPPKRSGPGAIVSAVVVGALLVGLIFALPEILSPDKKTSVTTTRTSYTPDATSAEPSPAQPSPTETEPTTTEVSTEPTTTEPTTTEPSTTEPSSTQPSARSQPALPPRAWQKLPGPHSSHPSWVVLQRNKLYNYDIPLGSCAPVPAPFRDLNQWKSFTARTINCQHSAWLPVFRRMGKPLPKPRLHFISGAVRSPCGISGAKVSFYCGTWDGTSYTIYMHTSLMEQSNTWWRLRAFETAAHEYFHHVQMMAGILYHNAQLVQLNAYPVLEGSRRLELQTSCVAGRMLAKTKATAWSREDYETYVRWSNQDQDSAHGSAKSNTYWYQRGLYMPKTGGCNTWVVHSSWVS